MVDVAKVKNRSRGEGCYLLCVELDEKANALKYCAVIRLLQMQVGEPAQNHFVLEKIKSVFLLSSWQKLLRPCPQGRYHLRNSCEMYIQAR